VERHGYGVAELRVGVGRVVDVEVDVDPAFQQAEDDATQRAEKGDVDAVAQGLREPDLAEINADRLEGLLDYRCADEDEEQEAARSDLGDDGAADPQRTTRYGEENDGDVRERRCPPRRRQRGSGFDGQRLSLGAGRGRGRR
jgi:hypothetical protein